MKLNSLFSLVFCIGLVSSLHGQVLPSSFGVYNPSRAVANSTIISSGLVLHLDAGNASSYPGSGTTWTDLSGSGNTGTLNGPTYSSANGGSLSFDGVNDYVSVSNTSQLRPSTELSIGMWIKANSITAGWVRLFGQDPYLNGGPLIFLENGGSLIRALHYPNGREVRCNTNYSISTAQYTYVVFTFKTGDAIRSYFNGVENTTVALSAGTFSYNTINPYLIGHTGTSWFNGNIAQVSIYNRALTAAEIQQNFNATRGRFAIGVVTSATGRIWIDRNLGATQVATSSTDAASYGDLYQWGRSTDGHQIRTSGTTVTLSSTDAPGNGNFIKAPNSPYDWRSPKNDNLWQGVSGVNNPCPTGYRIPTDAEWDAERTSWSPNYAAGAFASPLKLPMAGYRGHPDGSLYGVGTTGFYMSSTVSSTSARSLYFGSHHDEMNNYNRTSGFSVRCIKD